MFTAVMEIFQKHGAKFSEDFVNNYDTLFTWLNKWCKSSNRDDHKAALPAMDTFVTVIANVIELLADEDRKKASQILKVRNAYQLYYNIFIILLLM